jgi:transcription antitermination factor NusG
MSVATNWYPAVHFPITSLEIPRWYAVHTQARHEKAVAHRLAMQAVPTYLPLSVEVRRWSDRRKTVEVPLFPCYIFVRIVSSGGSKLQVLRTDGVHGFVGIRGEGTPIPEWQIESIRQVLGHKSNCTTYPFLVEGQRVRIRGGALEGVEGILQRRAGQNMLVVSVVPLQRSLIVSLEGYEFEPV